MHPVHRTGTAAVLLGSLIGSALLFSLLLVPQSASSADGDAGWALQFDGANTFIKLQQTLDVFGSTAWTATKSVSLWVKPEGDSLTCYNDSPAWCDIIFGDRPTTWGIARGIINGKDRIWVWNYSGQTNGFQKIGIEYTAGEWVHITLVHADGVLHAFRNGYEVDFIPSQSTQPSPNDFEEPYLYIGGAITSEARSLTFQGIIDEVRVYAVALNEDTVRATLQSSLAGNESGLVAYYKMTDGIVDGSASTQLSDDTGLGHNGQAGVEGFFPLWVASTAFDLPVVYPTLTFTPTFTRTRYPTFTPTVTPSQTPAPSPTRDVVLNPDGVTLFLPGVWK